MLEDSTPKEKYISLFSVVALKTISAVAKKMTSESISEQASAKLNQCSNDEYEEFNQSHIIREDGGAWDTLRTLNQLIMLIQTATF